MSISRSSASFTLPGRAAVISRTCSWCCSRSRPTRESPGTAPRMPGSRRRSRSNVSWRPISSGRDPTQVERLTAVLRDSEILGPPVYCMEIPLWDIIGKLAGLPVYKLWGGHSDRVLAYCSDCGGAASRGAGGGISRRSCTKGSGR